MTHFSLRFLFLTIILVCIYYIIQLFSFLFIPIFVAILITIFLRPIVRTLKHWTNLPKWIVIITVLFTFFISITGLTIVTFFFISKELEAIMQKFAASDWDLIAVPAQEWLDGKADKDTLVSAIKQADKECGSCGCELDPLYKRALELL